MTERAPEIPTKPFSAPEGVHEVEPDGDGAGAPDADLSGQTIPEDLSELPDGDAE